MTTLTFDGRGNLFPYETTDCNYERMAELFAHSAIRRSLFNHYATYSEELLGVVSAPFEQLIGGRFVTQKIDPNDVGVANLIALDDPDDEQIQAIIPFMTLGGSLESFSVDGHLIPVYSPDDERYTNPIGRIEYFQKWFGFDRNDFPRGIIRIQQTT